MSNAIVTAPATTCPTWCQQDHTTEPADHHAGRIQAAPGVEVIASVTPAHGVTVDILGEPSTIGEGGVIMSLASALGLSAVLRQLDASIPF